MRDISMERVNETRERILDIIESPTLTHEQKLTNLACAADSLMEVLDLPEGLDELLNAPMETKCICDLNEGHAPVRPRYIVPDYAKFMKEGSEFLQLAPPTDLYEALNNLLIFYKHVPSVTNYPVYVGQLDELLEPFIHTVDEAQARKLLKMFMIHIDRTVLDSFSHADIGPKATKAGELLLEVETELEHAVPNLTMKYEEGVTDDAFALKAINCALHSAKPSFANHPMEILPKERQISRSSRKKSFPTCWTSWHVTWMNVSVLKWRRAAFLRIISWQKKASSTVTASRPCSAW